MKVEDLGCAQELRRMKFQQFRFVYFVSFLFYVIPLLGIATPKKDAKRAKSAEAVSKFTLTKETRPVRTENIPILRTELLITWNTIFPEYKIDNAATGNKTAFKDVPSPYGELQTVENILKAAAKVFKGNAAELTLLKKAIEAIIKGTKYEPFTCGNLNLALGYFDKQTITFKKSDRYLFSEELKKRFCRFHKKIYGMNCVDGKDAEFFDAIEAVFKEDSEYVFEGVEVDWTKSNSENFKDHIEEEQEEPIKEDETDLKLIALKKAIDAYNLDKSKEKLEQVKIQWLKKLRGNASLTKKVDLTKPTSEDSTKSSGKPVIDPIETETISTKPESIPVVVDKDAAESKSTLSETDTLVEKKEKTSNTLESIDNGLIQSNNTLAKKGKTLARTNTKDIHQADQDSAQLNDLNEKDSNLPSEKKSSFLFWIILSLGVGTGVIVIVVVTVQYQKRK